MSAHRATTARRAARRSSWGGRITAFGLVIALSLAGTFTASVAWAFWSAGSLPGGSTTSTAATVAAGNTPTAVASPTSVALSWAASTLSTGTAVSGYIVHRYDSTGTVLQTTGAGCSGLITATTCTETGVAAGQWRYSVTPRFATNWAGTESGKSPVVTTEATPPVNAITLSNLSGMAVKSGNTVYYHGTAGGSFTLTNALTDAGSGPASSSTAALGGTPTGWTHSPSTVSSPAGGPFVSTTFTWAAGASSSPTEVVTGRDALGNQAATTLTFVDDSTAPTGTITYADGFHQSTSVSVAFTHADTAGSGVTSFRLQRASALYLGTVGSTSSGATAGSGCGTYSAFATIGPANPLPPYNDAATVNSTCYKYRYVVTDAVGNVGTITSASESIVDYAGAVNTTPTVVAQWRLGESSVTASRAADSKGSNTGDYIGGVTPGIGGELPRDANTAISPNGSSGYVQVPTASTTIPSGTSARSVELWFRTTSTARQTLFDYGSLAANQKFTLWLDPGGTTMTAWGWGAGNDKTFTMPSPLNNGAWHHVVKTWDGTAITLYIDGVALAPQTATRSTVFGTTNFNIGVALPLTSDLSAAGYFIGGLDEVSVYSSALSAATIANHYALGKNTSTDILGPTGGSIAATGLVGTGSAYATASAGSVSFTKGTDTPSGLAASGSRLMSATAPLSAAAGIANGTCGTFTAFSLLATDPSSPAADTMSDQTCYAYQYVVPDTLYNYTRYAAPTVVKVDTTRPTVAATATAVTHSHVSGSQIYYRGSVAGSFTINSGATDAGSGIASVAHANLGSGWTAPGTGISQTYSWTANPANPGPKTLTATNNAGLTSLTSGFTPVLDNDAPTGFSIYVTGAGATRQVGYVAGTDSGSGIASVVWERQNSLLCLLYGSFTPVTNPETTPANLGCLNYRLTVTDNVGNVFTASQIV